MNNIYKRRNNMKDKVVMLRTLGGEFIIGFEDNSDIVDANGNTQSTSDTYNLKDARIFNLQMTRQGAAIAFVPIFPFNTSKNIDKIEVYKNQVLLKVDEDLIDAEIINGYKSHISGIDLSASNKFVM